MLEVFKKETLTSREFPVIFMAAHGLLFFREGEAVVVPQIVVEVCTELRERGYRLAVVSNWRISLQNLLRDHLLLDFFESVIAAYDVGAEKPDRKIFEAALEDLSVTARESIFVGASWKSDIEGAKGVGIRSVLYDPELKELKDLGFCDAVPDTHDKLIQLNDLRLQKKLEGVMVVRRFQELVEIFQ